jgi:hypothetical protein
LIVPNREEGVIVAEDLQSLFASRADRFPEPDDSDRALGFANAIVESVPIVGVLTAETLVPFLKGSLERRRAEWFKEVADGLEKLEREVNQFKVSQLENDEEFVSAFVDASRIAVGTHHREK